jgi:hypothetical protein
LLSFGTADGVRDREFRLIFGAMRDGGARDGDRGGQDSTSHGNATGLHYFLCPLELHSHLHLFANVTLNQLSAPIDGPGIGRGSPHPANRPELKARFSGIGLQSLVS